MGFRIKRGLWYRIHSLREEARTLPTRQAAADRQLLLLGQVANHYGWTIGPRGRIFEDGFQRPGMRSLISDMLVGEEDRAIGRALWGYLSAITHLTWYGIRETLIPPFPEAEDSLRPTLIGVGSSSDFVNTLTVCLVLTFAQASASHLEYMGWSNADRWLDVRGSATSWATEVVAARAAQYVQP